MAILKPADMKNKEGATYSVLIIGGESTLRRELTAALAGAVFEVADTPDYFDALWKLDEFKPDLLFIDEELPLVDGCEACGWLHRAFGIPVILLGRDSSSQAWSRAVQAGADFYLRVPFERKALAARVKAILRRYEED